MSPELPVTWAVCEIGDVAQVVGGATPPSKDTTNFTESGGLPWITPADLSGYKQMYISRGARNLSEKGFAACSAVLLPAGTVLFSSRAPVGYVAIASNPVSTSQGFKSFVLPKEIDNRFVYYYLQHIKSLAEERATGTTFKELSGAAASHLPLVVAPTNEQKRIADRLEADLTRIDACRERLDRIPAILKRFRQAVLAAAASGKLTEQWRAETKPSEGWKHITISDLLMDIRYGTAKKCLYEPKKTPVLRIPNIIGGRVDLKDLKFAEFEKAELRKLALVAGDILMIRSNGSLGLVGRTALATEHEEGFLYAGYLVRLRINQLLARPAYVSIFLASPGSRDAIESVARSTSGVNNINAEEIKALPISVPSIEEQDEIIRRVDTLFAHSDRLEGRYSAIRTRIAHLTPALLAKAFRGELVPQEPSDEPASLLLKRIRDERVRLKDETGFKLRKSRGRHKALSKLEVRMFARKDIHPAHLTMILKQRGPLAAEALWSASQLDIDDFYDQLKDEEARGLLKETRGDLPNGSRLLEAAA